MTDAKSEPPEEGDELVGLVPAALDGVRADKAIATMFTGYSRSQLQKWLDSDQIKVNRQTPRRRDPVYEGDEVRIIPLIEAAGDWQAQPIDLNMVYEDALLLIVDKPAGLVVHPGAGNPDGTLVNALLYRYPELDRIPRAGIVHRLDKDTSGLLTVARSEAARLNLIDQLQRRVVKRRYVAIVCGEMIAGGTVDEPVGRHARDRTRMAITAGGKPALTHYRIRERFTGYTMLDVSLETGRTHQIRVHMQHLGFPVLGDGTYGGRRAPAGFAEAARRQLTGFSRQALHAARLGFTHPATGDDLEFESPLPEDISALVRLLRRESRPV